MCRRRQTVLVVVAALLTLTFQTAHGADPVLQATPATPQPNQEFIVSLQPDLDDTAGGTSIPAGTSYTWTVTPMPVTPIAGGKPFIKLSGPADTAYKIKVDKNDGATTKAFELTVTVGPTDQVDISSSSSDADLTERLGASLDDLKTSTPEFAKVATEIANAIQSGLDGAGTDVTKLQNGVRLNVRKAIKNSDNMPDETVRKAWVTAYNDLVTSLGAGLATFKEKSDAYLVGIRVLTDAAKTPGADLPGAIATSALDGDKISQEIVTTLQDKPLELLKLDTSFQRTCRALIAALEDLINKTDPAKVAATDYKEQTRAAVLEVIQKSRQAQVVKERWTQAYNVFLDRVSKSTILDDTKSEDWEKALTMLIVGLKKAIGVEANLIVELQRNQGRRTGSAGGTGGFSGGSGGSAAGGGSSGYGNTIHGVITARHIQRIKNRAAISRTRIQRIRGQ